LPEHTHTQPKSTLGRIERPTYLQHKLHHQSILLLTTHNCGHYPGHTRIFHPHQSTGPTSWQSWSPLPPYTSCPRLCHYYDAPHRNALHGFQIFKDIPNFPIHQTIGALFDIFTNTTSKILQRFHCLLPHIAEVACAPSIPPPDCINHFLPLVSPKSARSRLKLHLNDYLSHSLYNNVFSNAPNHFHLLPSLLSSQTAYHLIGLCRSNPHNCLLNWQLDIGIKRKLRLPLNLTNNQPICACGTIVDIFGDHIFKCTCICNIGVHNAIRDGLTHALAPVLSTAGFVPPNSTPLPPI
jgi:hypothetical protein